MIFNIITIFPEMIADALKWGVLGQACQKGLITCNIINLRDFSEGAHKQIDDKPYGGGEGMLMMAEPLEKALKACGHHASSSKHCNGTPATRTSSSAEAKKAVVYPSPQGVPWLQADARHWAGVYTELTFICGRYGGVDQRILHHFVDHEISVGEFVVSGGEWPALLMIDSISRHFKGVLGHPLSLQRDSLQNYLLEAPQFTKPRQWQKWSVLEVFLNGDHKKIERTRFLLSLLITQKKRPDLYQKYRAICDKGVIKKDEAEAQSFLSSLSNLNKEVLGLS